MSSSEVRTARLPGRDAPAATVADVTAAPVVLDRYRLVRRLGTGAFGTVWMARDERLERDVAVKILARERIVGGRFEREARAAARLAHPAIVTLYEAAVDDEGAYLVSELVVGSTLDTLLAEGRVSDRDVAAIGVALCDALTHAHAHGVVHRDVKPSNVLVPDAPASSAQVAKLTDFGVARVLGGDSLTLTGDVIGTLAYMAPEQADGQPAGDAADLYALALVIYEALTGVNPMAIATRGVAGTRRLATHLPRLRRQRRDLPRGLGEVVDRALAPNPGDRGSVGELRAALLSAIPLVGDEPGVVSSPWPTLRSTPTVAFGAASGEPQADWDPSGAAARSGREPGDHAIRGTDTPDAAPAPAPGRGRWAARALAAAGAAAVSVWLARAVLHPPPVTPAVAGLIAAAAVLLLPRLGWLALVAGAVVVSLIHDQAGLGLVLGLAGTLPVAVLAWRPSDWPLAAAAPALGFLGLAGAWPALAGRAPTVWRRAALGALGWVWLLAATPIAGRVLYLSSPVSIAPRSVWEPSASDALSLLSALARSGVIAGAAVWALAAVVAPWLLTRRSTVLDVSLVCVWAAVTAWGSGAAIAAVRAPLGAPHATGVVVGAIAAVAVALIPLVAATTGPGGSVRRRHRSQPRVP